MTGRILHFGPGNFHRAHQAIFTQQAGGWTITGVSLKSAGTRDALVGQAFDYTLVIRDADGERMERMTVLDDILVAPENPDAVLDTLADGSVQVVTVTVTEKGYHLNADGRLNLSDPEVAADLDTNLPRTLVGYLARGLMRRQIDMAGPISVISCDNLSGNGAKLRTAVLDFAQAAGLGLTLSEATFPDTMVDRITPRAPDDLSDRVAAMDLPSAAPVVTEGFSEWVIADDFAGLRPAWETAGARLVADVAPFEARKLRMLNGAHSMLAYAGLNRGFVHVHEAVADPDLRRRCRALMQAAAGTLQGVGEDELRIYGEALIVRFDNPALQHALAQIAMDGSQKMPVRIGAVLSELAATGGDTGPHVFALAEWCRFVIGQDGTVLDDPMAERLAKAAGEGDPVSALLNVIGIGLPEVEMELVRASLRGTTDQDIKGTAI